MQSLTVLVILAVPLTMIGSAAGKTNTSEVTGDPESQHISTEPVSSQSDEASGFIGDSGLETDASGSGTSPTANEVATSLEPLDFESGTDNTSADLNPETDTVTTALDASTDVSQVADGSESHDINNAADMLNSSQLDSADNVEKIAMASVFSILSAMTVLLAISVTVQILRKRRARRRFLKILHTNTQSGPQNYLNMTPQTDISTIYNPSSSSLKATSNERTPADPSCDPNSEQILLALLPDNVPVEPDYAVIPPKCAYSNATNAITNTNEGCIATLSETLISEHGFNSKGNTSPLLTVQNYCYGIPSIGLSKCSNKSCAGKEFTGSFDDRKTSMNTQDHYYEVETWTTANSFRGRANPTTPESSIIHPSSSNGKVDRAALAPLTSTQCCEMDNWRAVNHVQVDTTTPSNIGVIYSSSSASSSEALSSSTHDYEVESWMTHQAGGDGPRSSSSDSKVPPLGDELSRRQCRVGSLAEDSITPQPPIYDHLAAAQGKITASNASSVLLTSVQAGTTVPASGTHKDHTTNHDKLDATYEHRNKAVDASHTTHELHLYSTIPEHYKEIGNSTKSLETLLTELEQECGVPKIPIGRNDAYVTTGGYKRSADSMEDETYVEMKTPTYLFTPSHENQQQDTQNQAYAKKENAVLFPVQVNQGGVTSIKDRNQLLVPLQMEGQGTDYQAPIFDSEEYDYVIV